ncbi:Mitotic spindle checkpoint component mad2 [Diatrype stigma]|uniref:Mitotic spindle checkpoint component mad2 n=1 Tax=Diatrype stigma TaxID=117547 RepID=A0AAN9YU76_9PEZI
MSSKTADKDKSKVHKLSLKGSAKLVAEVKKYGLNMLVSSDDQVKAYIKKIMSQLDKWMQRGKISKLVIVITDKDTGEHVERWQFDVQIFNNPTKSSSGKSSSSKSSKTKPAAAAGEDSPGDQENAASKDPAAAAAAPISAEKSEAEIQAEIAALFRQITASVTFLPQLSGGDCTFNVLVYADADSDVPVEWGDSDAKEIVNGERVQLRGFSTSNHRVETLVSYRLGD